MADVLAKHYEGAHSDLVQYEGQYLNPLGTPVMPDVHITERKVRKALFTLKPNKAPGGDNITIVQLRKLQRTVVPYLTKIIKYSYETGYIYTHWHKVLIAPLHKPGKPRDQASSYRPVVFWWGHLSWRSTSSWWNGSSTWRRPASCRGLNMRAAEAGVPSQTWWSTWTF